MQPFSIKKKSSKNSRAFENNFILRLRWHSAPNPYFLFETVDTLSLLGCKFFGRTSIRNGC